MSFWFFFLLGLLTSVPCFGQGTDPTTDQIWEVGDRRWTIEEERKFEKWVDETITEDFFIRYGIPTDCADAVYATRWIYARIAHLPAAATTTDGRLIGQWSSDWKHLPTDPEWERDERFLAALFYLFPRTWTGTLPLDTYPVRVSPDSVRPGTLFLVTESHTGIVGHVFRDGSQAHPLQTWESALPVRVQKLKLRYFFSPKPEYKARSGLVRFRWPVCENGEWKYLPVKEHPFYSEEQYSPSFYNGTDDFLAAVAKRIDSTERAPEEKIEKETETVARLLKERVSIVREGYECCRDASCPEGSELWEIHNTLGRDGMISSLMDDLSQIIIRNHLDQQKIKERLESISINISEQHSVTAYQIYQNYLWLSSDPEHSIEARWGLKKCEMIDAQTRATHDSIAFIDRMYRRKDPKYADFSIQQQQRILRRLVQEWARSECREVDLKPEKKARVLSVAVPAKAASQIRTCEAIRMETHATHDAIAFIEKTYRKSDPAYAEFSIGQQEQVLRRLGEEWRGFKCSGSVSIRSHQRLP